MIAPGLATALLVFVLGLGALALGFIASLVAAVYGASRAAEHRPNGRALAWLGTFVGICVLNGILAFGGCVVGFATMNR